MSDEDSSHESLSDWTLYESLQSKSTELAQELEKHVASIQQKMENVNLVFFLTLQKRKRQTNGGSLRCLVQQPKLEKSTS